MSMLQVWKVKRGNHPRTLIITCPHCDQPAEVKKSWANPRMTNNLISEGEHLTVGRPCTYCFATSQLPENAPGGKPRG